MDICVAYDNPIIVKVTCPTRNALDGQLSTFDLKTRSRIANFPVVAKASSGRCSLSNDARLCFVGCFQDHGLVAYSTLDGSEIWRRNDLQILNSVTAFTHDDIVSCRRDEEAFLLCSRTGRTLDILHGIKRIYSSPFSKVVMVSARRLEIHLPFGKLVATIDRTTFGEVDCAFSETEVLITESGGPVRCFDLVSAKHLWTHTPPEGHHFLKLCYSRPLNCFVGTMFHYAGYGGEPNRIFHFNSRTGQVLKEICLDTGSRHEFCMAGTILFSFSLQMLSVETGAPLYQF